MVIKRSIIAVVLLLVVFAGAYYYIHSSRLVIKGQIESLSNERIYLDRFEYSQSSRLDSVEVNAQGEFRFVVRDASDDPMLYTLVSGWNSIPLLCSRGESIEIVAGEGVVSDYTVSGSAESELLREFYQYFVTQSKELRQISAKYARTQSRGGDVETLAENYSAKYRALKREQMRFIVEHQEHMVAIYALMQLLPGDSYLFSRTSDLIYKRTVAEGIAKRYPNSSYLADLKLEIERHERQDSLLSTVAHVDFPEIVMSDMYGDRVSLASLKGNVILLDFWSAELGHSTQNNVLLKKLYEQYKNQGFKVYQVGIDTSRSIWLTTIQKQRLPWISVSDLKGGNSPVLGLYNITQIPSNYLINSSGEIVGRDLYGTNLERVLAREYADDVNK